MADALISRRGGGGYATVKINCSLASPKHEIATDLSRGRCRLAATTVGSYALFGGGESYSSGSYNYHSTVDAYNSSLTRSTAPDLSEARCYLAATRVGEYALFGGGQGNSHSSTVDAYDFNIDFMVYKNSKYKFQNMAEEVTVTEDMKTISIPTPATGYIKFQNTTIS